MLPDDRKQTHGFGTHGTSTFLTSAQSISLMSNEHTRVLYTFRRCPYAIRARMAIFTAGIDVELREVSLKKKPQHMLDLSSKGTVPVLCDGTTVIDESLDIMLWALAINDPDQWVSRYSEAEKATALQLIDESDNDFKRWLDKYKYADRHPEHEPEYYRHKCTNFLAKLDNSLQKQPHLITSAITLADIAIIGVEILKTVSFSTLKKIR